MASAVHQHVLASGIYVLSLLKPLCPPSPPHPGSRAGDQGLVLESDPREQTLGLGRVKQGRGKIDGWIVFEVTAVGIGSFIPLLRIIQNAPPHNSPLNNGRRREQHLPF